MAVSQGSYMAGNTTEATAGRNASMFWGLLQTRYQSLTYTI